MLRSLHIIVTLLTTWMLSFPFCLLSSVKVQWFRRRLPTFVQHLTRSPHTLWCNDSKRQHLPKFGQHWTRQPHTLWCNDSQRQHLRTGVNLTVGPFTSRKLNKRPVFSWVFMLSCVMQCPFWLKMTDSKTSGSTSAGIEAIQLTLQEMSRFQKIVQRSNYLERLCSIGLDRPQIVANA